MRLQHSLHPLDGSAAASDLAQANRAAASMTAFSADSRDLRQSEPLTAFAKTIVARSEPLGTNTRLYIPGDYSARDTPRTELEQWAIAGEYVPPRPALGLHELSLMRVRLRLDKDEHSDVEQGRNKDYRWIDQNGRLKRLPDPTLGAHVRPTYGPYTAHANQLQQILVRQIVPRSRPITEPFELKVYVGALELDNHPLGIHENLLASRFRDYCRQYEKAQGYSRLQSCAEKALHLEEEWNKANHAENCNGETRLVGQGLVQAHRNLANETANVHRILDKMQRLKDALENERTAQGFSSTLIQIQVARVVNPHSIFS